MPYGSHFMFKSSLDYWRASKFFFFSVSRVALLNLLFTKMYKAAQISMLLRCFMWYPFTNARASVSCFLSTEGQLQIPVTRALLKSFQAMGNVQCETDALRNV